MNKSAKGATKKQPEKKQAPKKQPAKKPVKDVAAKPRIDYWNT